MGVHNPGSGGVNQPKSIVVNAGTLAESNSAGVNHIALGQAAADVGGYGSAVYIPTGVASSGNVGAVKSVSAGTVNRQGDIIGPLLHDSLAGVSNTQLKGGAAEVAGVRRTPAPVTGERKLDVTGYDGLTHAASYGSDRGAAFTYHGASSPAPSASGIDEAHPSNYARVHGGEIVYSLGGLPVQHNLDLPKSP